ncbi:hypothetical protein [Micromonospora zhanjiangensis]
MVTLINDLATRYAQRSPRRTPPLWVTSLARSVEHQHRLRSLGYAAVLPSSHCTGYGIDLEMTWLRRRGPVTGWPPSCWSGSGPATST